MHHFYENICLTFKVWTKFIKLVKEKNLREKNKYIIIIKTWKQQKSLEKI